MIEPLLDLPAHTRERLIAALESGQLDHGITATGLRSMLGADVDASRVGETLASLAEGGVPMQVAAEWCRSVERAVNRVPRADLVWSGPELPGVYARDTRRVFDELVSSAASSIWIATYAYFDGKRAFESIARQLDEKAELEATLLLNIQRRAGDTSLPADLVHRFAETFWKRDWPGTRKPRVFYDPRSLELDGQVSVLHAKAVVADEQSVFITSANLTEAAFDHNIEVGLLVRDRSLAASVLSYLRTLIERRHLDRLPG